MPKANRIGCLLLITAMLMGVAGCAEPEILPQSSSAPAVSDPTASVEATTDTTQGSQPVQPSETQPPIDTQPAQTQPTVPLMTNPATEPPATDPIVTEPSVTQPPATEPPVTAPPTTQPPTVPVMPPATTPPVTEPDYQGGISNQVTVEASGVLVKSSKDAVIDYSNTADGYVMACYTADTDLRLKVQVKGPSTTYTYNLTPQKWAAFPLSDENGEYRITIYQNITGTKYAAVLSVAIRAAMEDEFAPFLRSNQYVDFDSAPKTVAKAAVLTAGITDPLEKVEAVYDFVVGGMTYDTELAATVKSGYLPVLDSVLEKMSGICFDYAALMAGMLRSQGVPTKLVVGYAGEAYHAWISVWSESTGWVDGVIFFDGTSWQRMDPTFASSGGSSPDIMDYIGNGANYTAKYFY